VGTIGLRGNARDIVLCAQLRGLLCVVRGEPEDAELRLEISGPLTHEQRVRLAEIAERCGAEVHLRHVEWGGVFQPGQIEKAILETEPTLLALVHADTSTTMLQPFEGVGDICERHGVLFYADVTASLGGNPFPMDQLGVDVATAGLQKCLGGPAGSAPISLSPRAVERIERRRSVEAGSLGPGEKTADVGTRIRSNYFDLAMILDYWGARRLNHHTEATSMLYAARECARLLVEEGVDDSVSRHCRHGAAMLAGVRGLGLVPFGETAFKMNNCVGIEIPAGVDGEKVRGELLGRFGVEIGSSFGPLHGRIWRIGTMGYNARTDAVLTTLAALEQVLRRAGVHVPAGGGVDAALEVYQ
jgi:(S)-ureidoglycine-glyoxylate aminotransferase